MHSAMKTQVLFGLTLAFLFSGVLSATITITNNCTYTIWPGTLTGNGGAQLSTTGFELTSGASSSINVPAPFTGRFWARTECSTASGNFTCATADCVTGQVACNGASAVPPASLAEFDLAASGGQDFYDISLVDGFNLPLTITPQPQGGSGPTCTATSCAANINAVCPTELQVKGSDGSVIGCKSACDAFNQPQYCCTGAYSSPATCPPTNYSQFFRNECPQAYSYAYDDQTSTLACTGSPNYVITFCP